MSEEGVMKKKKGIVWENVWCLKGRYCILKVSTAPEYLAVFWQAFARLEAVPVQFEVQFEVV